MYRRTIFVLVVVLPALIQPLKAQDTATVTDRQLRQRLDYALSDTRRSIEELTEFLARMQTLRAAVDARIARDSLAPRPTTGTSRPPVTSTGPTPPGTDREPSTPAAASALVYRHDFNDRTIGEFGQWGGYTPKPVSVIADPTGSGRGNVARVVYERDPAGGGSRDVNGGMYAHPNPPGGHPEGVGFGDRVYFQGDFYIPSYPAGNTPSRLSQVQRKLTYLKFGSPAARSGGLFPVLWGRTDGSGMDLSLVTENNVTAVPTNVDGLAFVRWNTWYRMGLEMIVNHQVVADGTIRLWLNDALIYEGKNLEIFVAGSNGASAFIYEWGIGNQEQWAENEPVPMKNYRLWDNIEFRTARP
jgi:hypothetical protein